MADGVDTFGNFDLAIVDVATDKADFMPTYSSETLLPEERVLADRLIMKLVTSIQQLGLIKKSGATIVAARLIEKLQMANLGEDSVGVIAERVWWRLMKVSELGNGIPPDGLNHKCSGEEVIIAESILHRVEGRAFLLIRDAWKEIVRTAGPEVSSRVIRTVAKEAWPQVRTSLGL